MPLALLLACAQPSADTGAAAPFAEVIDAGLGAHIDLAAVSDETSDGFTTTVTWDPATGPRCLDGSDYRHAWRDQDPDKLLIFLQGGGACWSDFCFVITSAPPGIPDLDVTDTADPSNPVAGWSQAYLPYCDGSLFVGDVELDDDNDGSPDRYQHGLANLTAALQHTRARHDPEHILLAGSSGGGYGTILAVMLTRHLWPDARIDVFNDAGVGIAQPGEPAFVEGLLEEWGADHLVPADCPDCTADGHITGLIDWELAQDSTLQVAAFSSTQDSVIADIFLGIGGDDFEDAVRSETDQLHAAWPDRYQPFLVEGTIHTTLLGDLAGFIGEVDPQTEKAIDAIVTLGGMDTVQVDGVTTGEWLRRLVEDDGWGPVAP